MFWVAVTTWSPTRRRPDPEPRTTPPVLDAAVYRSTAPTSKPEAAPSARGATVLERLGHTAKDATRARAPTPRPTLEAASAARGRVAADLGAALTRARLEQKVPTRDPAETAAPTTRPPGEPYAPLDEAAFSEVLARAETDPRALDAVDNFRQTLPPAQQAEYDRMLASLRSDPRVVFADEPGVTSTRAERDLMLRGIAAANFNNPRGLEAAIAKASAGDGQFTLRAFDGPVPINRFYGSDGSAAGLALPEGGVAIDLNFLREASRKGDNPLLHEFSHVQQATLGADGKLVYSERFPPDFPFGREVADHLGDPKFQAFLRGHGYGADGIETWPTVQNLFHQFPEQLREASPEIYAAMVKYQGFDPLTQARVPPVRLGGDGSLAQAVPALAAGFDAVAGKDGRITEADLQRVADDSAADPELRAAAQYLLSSDTARHFLDVAGGRGVVDGRISAADLAAAGGWLARHGRGLDEAGRRLATSAPAASAAAVFSAWRDLFDTAGGRGRRDGHVSRRDLEAAAADASLPEHVRRAALYLIAHPELLAKLQAG